MFQNSEEATSWWSLESECPLCHLADSGMTHLAWECPLIDYDSHGKAAFEAGRAGEFGRPLIPLIEAQMFQNSEEATSWWSLERVTQRQQSKIGSYFRPSALAADGIVLKICWLVGG